MNRRRKDFWDKCNSDFELRVGQIYEMIGKDQIKAFSGFATPEFVERHLEKDLCWTNLSMNPSITIGFIELHLEREWDWSDLSMNPSITPEFVEKHPDWKWDWFNLSSNPSITPEFIERHPEKGWDWTFMSMNPSITPEFIEKHPDWKWYWYYLSRNPLITPEFIEKQSKIELNYHNFFSQGRAKSERNKIIMENLKMHLHAYRIQFWWRNVLENPHVKFSYEFTKKKLFDEFEVDRDLVLSQLN